MRQRYLRLISALLLLAVLTACGTDREGAAGGTVEGVVNRNGDFFGAPDGRGGVPDL